MSTLLLSCLLPPPPLRSCQGPRLALQVPSLCCLATASLFPNLSTLPGCSGRAVAAVGRGGLPRNVGEQAPQHYINRAECKAQGPRTDSWKVLPCSPDPASARMLLPLSHRTSHPTSALGLWVHPGVSSSLGVKACVLWSMLGLCLHRQRSQGPAQPILGSLLLRLSNRQSSISIPLLPTLP